MISFGISFANPPTPHKTPEWLYRYIYMPLYIYIYANIGAVRFIYKYTMGQNRPGLRKPHRGCEISHRARADICVCARPMRAQGALQVAATGDQAALVTQWRRAHCTAAIRDNFRDQYGTVVANRISKKVGLYKQNKCGSFGCYINVFRLQYKANFSRIFRLLF